MGDSRLREDLSLLRPAEVAGMLGLHRNTVYKWMRRGLLTRVRLGGATFVSARELVERLDRDEVVDRCASPDVRRRAQRMLEEFQGRGSRNAPHPHA